MVRMTAASSDGGGFDALFKNLKSNIRQIKKNKLAKKQ